MSMNCDSKNLEIWSILDIELELILNITVNCQRIAVINSKSDRVGLVSTSVII